MVVRADRSGGRRRGAVDEAGEAGSYNRLCLGCAHACRQDARVVVVSGQKMAPVSREGHGGRA